MKNLHDIPKEKLAPTRRRISGFDLDAPIVNWPRFSTTDFTVNFTGQLWTTDDRTTNTTNTINLFNNFRVTTD